MKKKYAINFFWFRVLSIFVAVGAGGFFLTPVLGYSDLMEQAFDQSMANDQLVDVGDTKEAVGNSFFFGGKGLECKWDSEASEKNGRKFWKNIDCSQVTQEPLLVRGIKLFLRLVIVLAIPMILFNAISLIASVISGTIADIAKKLRSIGIGILVILSAIALIYLVQSAVVVTILGKFTEGIAK